MYNIAVILATYNGEKYIYDQINSILKQNIPNAKLTIKIYDDLSSDRTEEIIKRDFPNDSVVFIKNSRNKGYAQNFLDAIYENLNQYDYIAVADQDDVWDEDKLSSAISIMQKEDKHFYFSNVRVTNENLKYIQNMFPDNVENIYNDYLENYCMGCTIVFDRQYQSLIQNINYDGVYLHDYFLFLLAKYGLNYIYDSNPHMNYRQHGDNSIGALKKRKTIFRKIKDFMHHTFYKDVKANSNMLKKVIIGLGLEKNSSNQHIFNLAYYKKNKMKILFKRAYRKSQKKANMQFKLRIVFNKF